MHRYLSIAILLVALAAQPAAAGNGSTSCCACLLSQGAMTGGASQGVPALLCQQVGPGGFLAFEDQCDAAGGNTIECVPVAPGQPCTEFLAAENVRCPGIAAAPAASTAVLAGMVLLLIAIGGTRFALTRRAR